MSDGLEERKNELFATITLLAGVKRQIAETQAAGLPAFTLYDRQAQLEADKERLSHEVNSEYMYRNLQTFMNRVDQYDTERKTDALGILTQSKEIQDAISALGFRFQTLADAVAKIERNMRALDKRHGSQIKALAKDIAAIKVVIAARPAERAADQRRLEGRLVAMEKRLAALEAHNNAE